MNRRNFCGVLGGAVMLAAPAWTTPVMAQSGRPLTMLVPYPAGGSSDLFARTVGQALGERLGRTVVVENAAGASGSIAANKVLTGRTPGEMLFMASPTEVILAPALLPTRYQPEDFTLLGLIDKAPLTLFVRKDLPVNSVDELVALARRPDTPPLTYGTTGPGSFYHLTMENLQRHAGLELTHVPYRGGAPMMQDLIAGNIDMMLVPASITSVSLVDSGRIRALAGLGERRSSRLPTVPTLAESQTLKDFRALDMWAGVMLPTNTPAEQVTALHAALAEVLAQPAVRSALESSTAEPVPTPLSLAEAAAFYQAQVTELQVAAKAAGIGAAPQ